MELNEVQKLFDSPVHEHRLAAVIILTYQYAGSREQKKRSIYKLYLLNVCKNRINNWDIVDISAPKIVGAELYDKDRGILFELSRSEYLWRRRVAIISTFNFLQHGDAGTSLELCERLLHDPHDLIQKATGWTLREIGKQVDESLLIKFLDKHAKTMPRTTLRYAIERLDRDARTYYMTRKKATLIA